MECGIGPGFVLGCLANCSAWGPAGDRDNQLAAQAILLSPPRQDHRPRGSAKVGTCWRGES